MPLPVNKTVPVASTPSTTPAPVPVAMPDVSEATPVINTSEGPVTPNPSNAPAEPVVNEVVDETTNTVIDPDEEKSNEELQAELECLHKDLDRINKTAVALAGSVKQKRILDRKQEIQDKLAARQSLATTDPSVNAEVK